MIPDHAPEGRIIRLPDRGETFARVDLRHGSAAPTVVLNHGWTVTADIQWFGCYAPLGERYNVVALDHAGNGRGLRSADGFALDGVADDNIAVLDALGIDRAIIVGFSMGGPVSLTAANRHPDRVRGLVLASTALEWREGRVERAGWKIVRSMSAVFRLGLDQPLLARVIRDNADDDPVTAEWAGHLLGEIRRSTPKEIAAAGMALSAYDARAFVDDLTMPMATVITTGDHVVRPSKQRRLAKATGGLSLDIDADHDVNFSHRAEFAELIVRAVDDVAFRSGGAPRDPRSSEASLP